MVAACQLAQLAHPFPRVVNVSGWAGSRRPRDGPGQLAGPFSGSAATARFRWPARSGWCAACRRPGRRRGTAPTSASPMSPVLVSGQGRRAARRAGSAGRPARPRRPPARWPRSGPGAGRSGCAVRPASRCGPRCPLGRADLGGSAARTKKSGDSTNAVSCAARSGTAPLERAGEHRDRVVPLPRCVSAPVAASRLSARR